ncbi:MAG: FHA domain-containing protein [Planctomycetota bacterium]
MNCEKANRYILGFISGTLTESELHEFNEHLEFCMRCASRVIAEKELDHLLKEKMVNSVTVTPGLDDKIISRIGNTPVLKITTADGKEDTLILGENPITFGRDAKNTIPLPSDVKLSREHCRIEYKGGKYEIIDLNSSNGIYINNQKTTSRLLEPDDKIRIGQTNIIFELPKLKGAGPIEEASAHKILQPTTDIATGKRHKPYPLKNVSRNSATPYIVAAAVVLLLILVLIARPSRNTTYSKTTSPEETTARTHVSGEVTSKLQAQINILKSDINVLTGEYRYEEALNKCQEFLIRYNYEINENQKDYLQKKVTSLEQSCRKENEVKGVLVQIENETKSISDPKLIRAKYESFCAASSNTSFEPKIKERIAILDEMEKAQSQIPSDLSASNYARAIGRYSPLMSRCDDQTIKELIAKVIDSVNQKAKPDFESIIRQGQEFANQGDYQKVKSLYLANFSRFQGTSYLAQLNSEISAVDKLIVQDKDNKTVAKKISEKILPDVAELTGKYDYKGAVQKSTEAIKIMEGYYPQVSEPLSAKLPDLEKQAALFGKLAIKIDGKNISLPRLNLKGTVSNPTGEGFNISGTAVKLSSLTPEEIYTLCKATWLTTSEPEGIAIFCLEHKLMDYAFESLNLLLQKSSKRKPELDALLARYSGKKVPPEGFIIYKSKWLTPDEKTVLINTENANNLVNNIKTTNKPTELEKICRDFEGLVQATPSQALEFKGIIIPILQQRVEELKGTIQKKLGKTNLEVLSQLKKELNQKRKEALKEIREGKPDGAPGEKPSLSKKMDEKIRAVKALWEKPAEKAIEIDKSMNNTAELLRAMVNELKKYTATPKNKGNDEEDIGIDEDTDMITVLASGAAIDIRNFPLNTTETRQMEYNRKVMKENEENKTADSIEKEMVRIINEYRIMMGLQACRLHDQLSRASRKHSQFMQSVGKLAHEGIGNGTPTSRLQAEGFSGPNGENCAAGQGTPLGYFTGWYWSYGHHLNMISGWTLIGGGISGDYATTNFGQ